MVVLVCLIAGGLIACARPLTLLTTLPLLLITVIVSPRPTAILPVLVVRLVRVPAAAQRAGRGKLVRRASAVR